MPFPLLFKLTLYLLVLDALGALYLTDILGPPALLVVGLAVGASWWAEAIRARVSSYRRLWDLLTALYLGYALLDMTLLAESFMAAVVHLLCFLLLYKLYNARTHRDLLDLFILTFLLLVSASTLTASFGFLLVFCGYMLLGIWGLICFHLTRETELACPERSREMLAAPGLIAPRFLASSLCMAVAALLLTLVIFFVIPRVGRSFLPLKAQLGTQTTGFSDRVDLGVYGSIQNDPTIVMRVSFPDDPQAAQRYPDLRWRGVAFDRFDGRAWSLVDPERRPLHRARDGSFVAARPQAGRPFLTQEIFLEPMGTEVIFGLFRVIAVLGRFPALAADAGGGLALPAPPGARLRYLAISQPESARGAASDRSVRSDDIPAEVREAYLQLPPLSPRVRDLARRLTAGAATPAEAARRVERYLDENLHYSLELGPGGVEDPLDDFLFERRRGNCEFFAAAMAILLRAGGVPTRVINGFQRGEWNEIGQFLTVRQRDAHSWVEVYLPETGWATFDPSPRAAFEVQAFGASGWAGKYFDALRMRWNRYVIDYNVGDQASFALSLRRQSLAVRQGLGYGWDVWAFRARRTLMDLWRAYGPAAAALLALGLAALVLWRGRPGRDGAGIWRWRARIGKQPVVFYERMVRLLARRGASRHPSATAREFAASLADCPQLFGPVAELTGLYERVRFGGEPLSAAEQERTATLLKQLDSAPR